MTTCPVVIGTFLGCETSALELGKSQKNWDELVVLSSLEVGISTRED